MTTVNPQVAELVPTLHERTLDGLELSAALVEHDGELFVEFRGGKYGAAQIAADSHISSAARVNGHWAGYCQANGSDLSKWQVTKLTPRQMLWVTEHDECETRNGTPWREAFKRGSTYIEGTYADLAEMADFFERLDADNFMVPGPFDMTEAQHNFSERALVRSLDALARKVRKALPRRFFC
jgi:hypothetical protein